MTNREVSRQALAAAVAAIELQREVLGEAVATTALFALRQRMAQTEIEPSEDQQAERVVLAADLSGFTALAEQMDAERVREAINAMWQVLDGVVQSWGGHIDQHAGDGMVAIFGLPRPRPRDLQRALRAALALQVELHLFNELARQQQQSWATAWPGPTMRIGIHQGPVFFGKASYGNRRTAVGETVNLAKALEQVAPVGGVLVSSVVAQEARAHFSFIVQATSHHDDKAASIASPAINGQAEIGNGVAAAGDRPFHNGQPANTIAGSLQQAHQLVAEQGGNSPTPPGLVAGKETRFVGRERELDFLETALQTVLDGRLPQIVTISAEPGLGSSRLLYEFERRLRLLPERVTVLHSQMNTPAQQAAPSFWKEMLFHYAGLRFNDSPGVMREKLAIAIDRDAGPRPGPDTYHLADALLAIDQDMAGQRPQPIEEAGQLLEALNEGTAVVMFLEQLHLASDQSLDLLEAVVEQHPDLPLLVVATAQTTFFGRRPGWQAQASDPFSPYSHLHLPPLSAIDGRHLLAELLQPLTSPPLRLLDLVATAAQGNPLYMEETVRQLLEQGAITIESGGRWLVDMSQVEATRLPSSLDALLQMRFNQLSADEQQLLGTAAAVGPVFWDAALWQDSTADTFLTAGEIDRLLPRLAQKGFISANQMWCFGNTEAFTFANTSIYRAAYAHLAQSKRRRLQRQIAYWLQTEWENGRMSRMFPTTTLLAHYVEQAGEATRPLDRPTSLAPLHAIHER